MIPVTVKSLVLGTGSPKICVPVTGKNVKEICEQTRETVDHAPDLIEWRADFFDHLDDPEAVEEVCDRLAEMTEQIPLIFTVRSEREGGSRSLTVEEYIRILKTAAGHRAVDMMDVELFMEPALMEELIHELQTKGKKVIASNHHFEGTPSREQMRKILEEMEASGADIRKLAVMPHTGEDVLELLAATIEAYRSGNAPVITMSMGQLGAVSRIAGELSGSCVTFGTVGEASAPGQLKLEDLRKILPKFGI